MNKEKVFIYFDPILKAIASVREVRDVRVVRRPLNYVTWKLKNHKLDVYFPVTDRYLTRAALRVTFEIDTFNMREIKRIVSVIWRFIYYYSIFPFEMIKTIMLSTEKIEDFIFYLLKSSLFYLDMDEASFLLLAENHKSIRRAFSLSREQNELTEYQSTARLVRGLSRKVLDAKERVVIKDVYFEDDINPKIRKGKKNGCSIPTYLQR